MAFATGTTNYGLPQWGENEHVEISPDINEAFADIDTQMKANQDNINLLMPVRGSGTNGTYTKFPDGTLQCAGTKAVTASASGVIDSEIVFPFSSTVTQNVIPVLKDVGNSNWAGNLFLASTAGDKFRVVVLNCVNNGNYAIEFISVGKWK